MITLKTNNQTIVNTKTQLQDYVYMNILDINFNLTTLKYEAKIEYYYIVEEIIDGVTYLHKHDLEKNKVIFTQAEATAIENGIVGGLVGNNFTEKFLSLITAGTFYQLSITTGLYGASGWTIVPTPVNGPLLN